MDSKIEGHALMGGGFEPGQITETLSVADRY